ncbi:MAG: sensor histidine kinase [Gemmatimonadetes bacterium]|nr:sensor histidine kinase [Gemmatimonadota bacterium]
MTYSLRRTLAVRFSLTIFAALLLIALWAFLGAQRTLRTALDNGLVSALNLERDVLASGSTLPAHAGPTEFGEFVHNVNRFVVVRDARGNILNMNTALAGDLPIDSAGFALARDGGISWVTTPWGDERVRSVYAPVPTNSPAGMSVVQVAASLHPLAEENREVLFLLLGTVLLGTVATAFGAVWLAGSAVQPVGEITAQAEAIEAGVSGQRITAHADVAEFHGLVAVLNSVLERLDRAFQAQRRIIADVAHEPVDLATLAASAVQRVHPRAGGRALRFQGPWAGSVTALADPGMIGVLLDQLLDNAVRHTPPDTRVEAIVRANGGKVSVAVRDNGPGIAEEVLPHLFERFYRADPARSRTAGPGLGLTVAAAIAQAHRGSIRAANLPTGGLEVTVALPSDHAEG